MGRGVAVQSSLNLSNGPMFAVPATPTNGLVIARNVNNVVFAGTDPSRIEGFSGAGIQFVGGSKNSRLANITSTNNGTGLRMGVGYYDGTTVVDNSFPGNFGDGAVLTGAAHLMLGTPTLGNEIIFNMRAGIRASGVNCISVVQGNQIATNAQGNIPGMVLVGSVGLVPAAPGLTVKLTPLGRAALKAEQSGLYGFSTQIGADGVSIYSDGSLNTKRGLLDMDAADHGMVAPNHKLHSAVTALDNSECGQAARFRGWWAWGRRTRGARRGHRPRPRLMRQTAFPRQLAKKPGPHSWTGWGRSFLLRARNVVATFDSSRYTQARADPEDPDAHVDSCGVATGTSSAAPRSGHIQPGQPRQLLLVIRPAGPMLAEVPLADLAFDRGMSSQLPSRPPFEFRDIGGG